LRRLLALDGDEGKPERQLRLVPQRALLCRFRKGCRDEFLGLRHPTNLHERVGLADKGHEGHLQFRDSARDLECAFVEVERLLGAAELDVPVPEESEPTYERRGVAVRLGDLDGLSEIHDCGVRVALEERDQSEFATRAICPSGFIEFLGERKCLGPGALRQ